MHAVVMSFFKEYYTYVLRFEVSFHLLNPEIMLPLNPDVCYLKQGALYLRYLPQTLLRSGHVYESKEHKNCDYN